MNKYNIGDIVMLKENLILVKISKIKRSKYCVYYPHLKNPHDFWIDEDKLQKKPFNYEEKIFEAYIDYRYKYEELCRRLLSPSVRDKY